METTKKIIIYQVFTRLFGNQNKTCQTDGSIEINGCGKMDDFTKQALHEIKKLGATHVWYTGLLAHASQTDYTAYGIPRNHPSIVKERPALHMPYETTTTLTPTWLNTWTNAWKNFRIW